jgi:myo-inositol 2-dehydrogenase / D-chiro-inositol 1-dehydrogenase
MIARCVPKDLYQVEHDELFASIRAGQPMNNGEYMAKSTLLAIMGRMATYTGQEITWDMVWKSKEDLSPPRYEGGEIASPPIAVPGLTRYV